LCNAPKDVSASREALASYVPITQLLEAVWTGGQLIWPDEPAANAAILAHLWSNGFTSVTLAGMPRVPRSALADDSLEDLIDVREAHWSRSAAELVAPALSTTDDDFVAMGALRTASEEAATVTAARSRLGALKAGASGNGAYRTGPEFADAATQTHTQPTRLAVSGRWDESPWHRETAATKEAGCCVS